MPAQLDVDGDDVPGDQPGPPLAPGQFERVGRAPAALQRIRDLTPLDNALYAAHATRPLGLDGATVSRFRPADARPWSIAFDWNRAGEPSKGGGAGQGFWRVHAIGGRLFVPDADPPYNGFSLSEPGTEGFVFVSTPGGEFARARMPGHLPPRAPDAAGFAPPRDRAPITQEDVHAVRVTEGGTAQTLRWYADGGSLYWIAWNREGVALRVSTDGDSWRVVPLPGDVGVPTDIVRFRGALHVLTSRALLRLDDQGPTVLSTIADKHSPFELDDGFCAAPLAVFQGELYAGGQRDGALYRFKPGN